MNDLLLSGLYPLVKEAAIKTFAKLDEMGCPCVLESAYRSFDEQQKLYDLGRTIINPDGASDRSPMGNIITNAVPGYSWHNYGLAIDITRLDKDGKKTWELPYKPIGDAGKELGFEWGGDWETFKDLPHLQMRFGYKLTDVQLLVKALGIKGLWERIDQKGWV